MPLTKEQQAIVDYNGNLGLVLAVAGAGKTSTLAARIKTLSSSVNESSILYTSFAKANCEDMLLKLGKNSKVACLTLHQVALKVLRYAKAQGLYDADTKPTLYQHEKRFSSFLSKEKAQLKRQTKNPLLSLDLKDLGLKIKAWKFERAKGTSIDFDDILINAIEVLNAHESVRLETATWFKHVMVDEFQDINPAQYELLKFLSTDAAFLAIGDAEQAIYGFRGATPKFIKQFQKDAKDVFIISDNFRCRPEILNMANHVLGKNMLSPVKTFGGYALLRPETEFTENVEFSIKRFGAENTAILVRTWHQVAAIKEKLEAAKIEFTVLKGNEEIKGVTITSIHKSKGLEWDSVIIPNADNGVYPAPKSNLEEERRLFYVAVTRAKEELIVTASNPCVFIANYAARAEKLETLKALDQKNSKFQALTKEIGLQRHFAIWA